MYLVSEVSIQTGSAAQEAAGCLAFNTLIIYVHIWIPTGDECTASQMLIDGLRGIWTTPVNDFLLFKDLLLWNSFRNVSERHHRAYG